jgi:hypothetical protein
MSCICLLDPRLKIAEVPGMLYKEREGRSKLSVVRDGFRFLWTILFSACCYAPIKTMALASAAVAAALAAFCILLATTGHVFDPLLIDVAYAGAGLILILLSAGLVAHELNYLLIGPRQRAWYEKPLQAALDYRRLILGGIGVGAFGLLAIAFSHFIPPFSDWYSWPVDKAIHLLPMVGALMLTVGVLVRVIWAVGEKQKALLADEYKLPETPAAVSESGGAGVPPAIPAQQQAREVAVATANFTNR